MKKAGMIVFCCLLLGLWAPTSRAAGAGEAREAMIAAAVAGDEEAGAAAGAESSVDWEELFLLSRALYARTGNRTYEECWRLCIGEVILNRVASPEFPDTLEGVIRGDAAYSGKVSGYFDALRPDRSCAEIAWRLLEGERYMDDATVVYEGSRRQGGGVCLSLYDYRGGDIYFCYTASPALYR